MTKLWILFFGLFACAVAFSVVKSEENDDKGLEKRSPNNNNRQVQLQRRRQEEQRRRQEEQRRRQEEQRRQEERRRQEKALMREQEKIRKEQERQKQEAERRRKQEEERRQKENERRKEQEERRKQEEERRRLEEERRQKEHQMREQRKIQKEKEWRERLRQQRERQEERKRQWEIEYQKLKQEHRDDKDFWKLKENRKEDNYPQELKEKVERHEHIRPDEEDKFENEFGRYKTRSDTKVIDLLTAINSGHDIENLDEGDMLKEAPSFELGNMQHTKGYCKNKENKGKSICRNKGGRGRREAFPIYDEEEAWVRKKRDGRRDRVYLWIDRRVPYEIDSALAESQPTIVGALKEIESKTCVRFVQHSSNDNNWIRFVKKPGCWSSVGRKFWVNGYQELSLGSGCIYHGIIMHEVMHALGFYHEQSRSDRDQYVEVFWENIQPGKENNFAKENHQTSDLLGAHYDYKSIMHYGKYSFALNAEKPSMLSIQNPAEELGQRQMLSDTDIYQINQLYSCQVSGNAGWSAWSSFGPCDLSCNKKRSRFCMDTQDRTSCANPTSTVMLSWGIDEQMAECSHQECNAPVNGNWNKWGDWGQCSVTCQEGVQTRSRDCNDPSPKNGGKDCVGSKSEAQKCIKRSCTAGPADCYFDIEEEPLCKWKQSTSDDLDWTRKSGTTPSSSTGPSGDHTTGTGFYLFMESSAPAQNGWKARLESPVMSNTECCMSFAYHMYGHSTGTLSVRVKSLSSNQEEVVFTKSGDQLNEWKEEKELDISSDGQYQILIEAERSFGFQGDIAIDDVVITDGKCGSTSIEPPKLISTVSTVGCYRDVGYLDGKRPFPLLKNFREEIDWDVYMQSLNKTVFKCASFARENNYEFFAIEFYGECWTGNTTEINYGRDGEATDCFPQPKHNLGPFLVGSDFTMMVYRWIDVRQKT